MVQYQKPDWLTKHVFNPLVAFVTSRGLSVRGSRLLVVRGRKSGQIRTTPVNPLEIGGDRKLGAPPGGRGGGGDLEAAPRGEEVGVGGGGGGGADDKTARRRSGEPGAESVRVLQESP